MTISRGQMERQLRMGGGIMDIVPREPAIFGGIKKAVKKVGKTVKKIAKSDLGKAALLYAGTAGLGALGAGQAGTGFKFLGKGSFLSPSNVLANLTTTGKNLGILKSIPDAMQVPTRSGPFAKFFDKPLSSLVTGGGKGTIGKAATLGLVSTFLTKTLGMAPEQAEAELARDPSGYLERYYRNLNPNASEEEVMEFVTANTQEYAVGGRVGFDRGTQDPKGVMSLPNETMEDEEMVIIITQDKDGNPKLIQVPKSSVMPDMTTGRDLPLVFDDKMDSEDIVIPMDKEKILEGIVSRDNRREGNPLPPDPTQPVNPFKPKPIGPVLPNKEMAGYGYNEAMSDTFDMYLDMKKKGLIPPTMEFDEFLQEVVPEMSSKRIEETRGLAAVGGKMDTASNNAMQAAGIEGLPIRQNPKGVKELDLRETGGFIPPVGIKEKEDDIPAMLSNNEFVFTADAVRGMGGGNVNKGAQMLYDQMKMLEKGGRVV